MFPFSHSRPSQDPPNEWKLPDVIANKKRQWNCNCTYDSKLDDGSHVGVPDCILPKDNNRDVEKVNCISAGSKISGQCPLRIEVLAKKDQKANTQPAAEERLPKVVGQRFQIEPARAEIGMPGQAKDVAACGSSQTDQQPPFASFLGNIEEPVAAVGNNPDDEEAEIPGNICKGNLNEPEKGTPLVDRVPNANNESDRSECEDENQYL